MIEYRIVRADDSFLRTLGQEGWQLVAISDGKFYLSRPERKQTDKANKPLTLHALESLRNMDGEIFHRLSSEVDPETLKEFADYWLEKGEGEKKHRFEKQTSFDIARRLAKWIKNNVQSNNRICSL